MTESKAGDSRGLVLIVEDDEDLAALLQAALSDLPVDIQHVAARGAAMDLLDKVQPSLLLLDLGLPDGDGSQIVEQLKVTGRDNMPLVVYTIRDLGNLEKASLKLGESHFLTKSRASLIEVRELIEEMISRGVVGGTTD